MASNSSGMNQLVIMSDEHARSALGCYGHPIVKTPNIDSLARSGVRFENAYCNSPLCVPSRASMHTGQPVHALGAWDNAHPYLGDVESWQHRLRNAGHTVVSVGKLHFRNETDDTGFSRQIVPMHLVDGEGQLHGLLRDPLPAPRKKSRLATEIGVGETSYQNYDTGIVSEAKRWLFEDSKKASGKPWTLFVSFVCPHPPYKAAAKYFDMYAHQDILDPKGHGAAEVSMHPWLQEMITSRNDDEFFTPETRRIAIAAYYGLCTFMDSNVGEVLEALADSGQAENTRIIYTSDHGEALGSRRMWGKLYLYEESIGIPLIVSGPGVPVNQVSQTPVSLLDIFPSVLDTAGLHTEPAQSSDMPQPLWDIANKPDDIDRVVFSEYHGASSISGAFALRSGRYKLIYYVGFEPELFDLEADPEELHDLAQDPAFAEVRERLQQCLYKIVNPEDVDRRAKTDQAEAVERHGGRNALEERGTYQGTPVPGERPIFLK
jgi:choline-sulfatase